MTRLVELFRLGLRNLWGYPLRTLLTALGVVFGVGSVIAMLALGAGAEQAILEKFGSLGIRNIILNSVEPPDEGKGSEEEDAWQARRFGLTYADARQIEETVQGLDRVLRVHKSSQTAWWGSRRVEATVYAVEPDHLPLFRLEAVRGRTLCRMDDARLERVCVVRPGLLRELGVLEDPIGLWLQVGSAYYRIVGLLEDREFLGYAAKVLAVDSKTSEIYIPYRTGLERVGTRVVERGAGSVKQTDVELSQLVVAVDDLEDVVTTSRMLDRVLAKNHEKTDYEMVVPLEALAQERHAQEVFNIAMVGMASISLIVGGIGIANIMLATVTERTREIGVRRALGAKRRHIVAQFLAETVTISTAGGLLGVAAGFGMIEVLILLTGWNAIVTPQRILLAVGISVAVGVLSGIFPARRAALLDPIEALRHE